MKVSADPGAIQLWRERARQQRLQFELKTAHMNLKIAQDEITALFGDRGSIQSASVSWRRLRAVERKATQG
jgi:hypothetical protein